MFQELQVDQGQAHIRAEIRDAFNRRQLQYEFVSARSSSIPVEAQPILTAECHQVAQNANFGVSLDDVRSHLFGGNYEISFIKENGRIKGFGVFAKINIEGKNVLYLHGIVIDPTLQGKGFAKKLIEEKIKEDASINYFALRTHNPSMYYTAFRLTDNKNNVFPNFIAPPTQEILNIAHKLEFFKNMRGELCDDNLRIKYAYPQDMTQKFVDQNAMNAQLINENFSIRGLGRFDAQGVIVKIL